jgi:hypothetical protein
LLTNAIGNPPSSGKNPAYDKVGLKNNNRQYMLKMQNVTYNISSTYN